MKEWKIRKDLHNSMVIDFEKKTIRCAKDAWFKLETANRVFIFRLGNRVFIFRLGNRVFIFRLGGDE